MRDALHRRGSPCHTSTRTAASRITDACGFAKSGDALEWTVLPGGVIEECHTPLNRAARPAATLSSEADARPTPGLTLYRFHADGFAGRPDPVDLRHHVARPAVQR